MTLIYDTSQTRVVCIWACIDKGTPAAEFWRSIQYDMSGFTYKTNVGWRMPQKQMNAQIVLYKHINSSYNVSIFTQNNLQLPWLVNPIKNTCWRGCKNELIHSTKCVSRNKNVKTYCSFSFTPIQTLGVYNFF